MKTFKVTPTHRRLGYQAPSLYVEVAPCKTEEKIAEDEARSLSRLSDFSEWRFKVEEL